MKFRYLCLLAFLAVLFSIGAGHALRKVYPAKQAVAVEKAAHDFPELSKQDGRYTEMGWDELLPPGWNPAALFGGLNLDTLEDNDPRAEKIMQKLVKMLDEAPANPSLQGKRIKISGFVASLDFTGTAELKEFLLVPYFGACIHAPPPPANQIVHVTLEKARRGIRSMDMVTVFGKLDIARRETDMGRSGYAMQAVAIEPYVEKRKR